MHLPPVTAIPASGRRTSAAESVTVTGVTKSFGPVPVLRGVDLDVPAGSLVALLGPSGCGKTTLLRVIAGLERHASGEVRVGDRVLSGPGICAPAERRRLGMVFQDPAVFPHLTVARNVGYGLPRGVPDREARIDEALDLVGLSGFGPRSPATLSGGQLQRVALARALAPRPSVVLLDEPFSALDAPLRAELRLEVRRVLRAIDATAIFVTHDQEEAFVIGDEVAVMRLGAIVQQGPPSELYERPATREVAEFIGEADFLRGDARGGAADTLLGSIPLRGGARGPVDVMVRPEWVVVGAGDAATIDAIEYFGHDAVYRVLLDDGTRLRSRIMGAPALAPGDRIDLGFAGPAATAYPLRDTAITVTSAT